MKLIQRKNILHILLLVIPLVLGIVLAKSLLVSEGEKADTVNIKTLNEKIDSVDRHFDQILVELKELKSEIHSLKDSIGNSKRTKKNK
jgi:septal ring factor EnvC (AmiA/AmiB activator)